MFVIVMEESTPKNRDNEKMGNFQKYFFKPQFPKFFFIFFWQNTFGTV